GRLHFDELLQRIHPAASRIRRLAQETPAKLMIFDLLVDGAGKSLLLQPLVERRRRLEEFHRKFARSTTIELSPATTNLAQLERWLPRLVARGCDGVVAKLAVSAYRSGDRSAMLKIKRWRTADCVAAGFRHGTKFLRWRPDKAPRQCTFQQLEPSAKAA